MLSKFKSLMGVFLLAYMLIHASLAHASVDVREFDSEAQEAQYRALIEELRCPKCQNQNLASSDAIIAQDLKQKTYELVMAGKSDAEIIDYMKLRYGDFITYTPPVNSHTWWLWFAPPICLLLLLLWWGWKNKAKLATKDNQHNARDAEQNALSASERARLDVLLDEGGDR